MAENALSSLIDFAMEKLPEEPARRRAALYRNIAAICGNEQQARSFIEMARDLERVERRHRQMLLKLD